MQEWSPVDTDTFLADETIADAEPNRAIASIVSAVGEQRARIIANWALRVATLPAFRALPNLALDEVQRHIPELLDGALAAIAISDPQLDPEPLQRAEQLAAAHGRARLRDGFRVGDLLTEFHALRRETVAAIERVADELMIEPDPFVRVLQQRLRETLDALTVAAANAWAEAIEPR
jgi:hypothetical protein